MTESLLFKKVLNIPDADTFFNLENSIKSFGFLTFSGGIEMEHWAKMG